MSAAAGQQITVPARLAAAVRRRPGADGPAWLAALPGLVGAGLERWELTPERVVEPGGRHALVCAVRRADGSPAVLKLTPPGPAGAQEHAALAHWAGRGAVLALAAEPADGALLLERLHGDIPLRSLAEAKAMLEAAGLLQRLWVAPPEGHGFGTLSERAGALADGIRSRRQLAPEAVALADEAVELAAALAASGTESYLLHGDFHHGKVLAADRSPWLAVSPRPLVGERAWDLARLAQDRMDTLVGSPGQRGAVRRRLHQLADAVEVDHGRLRGWTLVRTVATGLHHLEAGSTGAAELYLEFADWL
ncbi:aminoglycoside phosphotransferase family protein [Kitasatospora sp. NPDC096147]|uniref:aminoglycoside phosphotransferase family protein n=1 Tax=Kitasatospora sp. NPDC096147 TaxID=3364093 RepID=UPI0038013236